jgi:hypothetical protein
MNGHYPTNELAGAHDAKADKVGAVVMITRHIHAQCDRLESQHAVMVEFLTRLLGSVPTPPPTQGGELKSNRPLLHELDDATKRMDELLDRIQGTVSRVYDVA